MHHMHRWPCLFFLHVNAQYCLTIETSKSRKGRTTSFWTLIRKLKKTEFTRRQTGNQIQLRHLKIFKNCSCFSRVCLVTGFILSFYSWIRLGAEFGEQLHLQLEWRNANSTNQFFYNNDRERDLKKQLSFAIKKPSSTGWHSHAELIK